MAAEAKANQTEAIDPLAPKGLDDVTEGTELVSSFDGETGEEVSTNVELVDQADEKVDESAAALAALVAKATAEAFKVNVWDTISFTVLPFNFDLKNLSGLYVVNKNHDSQFLIETRPEFTAFETFVGSDYLLGALGYDADKTIKRLADAFLENQIIRAALIKETNSAFIGDATSSYEVLHGLP